MSIRYFLLILSFLVILVILALSEYTERHPPEFRYPLLMMPMLIFVIRSVYRTAELSNGFNGRINNTQRYFSEYLFLSLMPAVRSAVLNRFRS